MQRIFLTPCLIAVSLLYGGCTQTTHLAADRLPPDVRRQIEETARHRQATLVLTDGTQATATGLVMGGDSISWSMPGGERIRVANALVRRIQFRRRASGALEGFFLGTLTGLAGGFAVVLFGDRQDLASDGAARLMPLGALLGLASGLVRGNRERYAFRPPLPAAFPPTPPLPSPDPARAPVSPAYPPRDTADVSPPNPPRDTADAPVRTGNPPVGWYIVVASRLEPALAAADRQRVAERLGTTVFVLETRLDATIRYRVLVGPYASQRAARAARRQQAEHLPEDAWLFYVRPGS